MTEITIDKEGKESMSIEFKGTVSIVLKDDENNETMRTTLDDDIVLEMLAYQIVTSFRNMMDKIDEEEKKEKEEKSKEKEASST